MYATPYSHPGIPVKLHLHKKAGRALRLKLIACFFILLFSSCHLSKRSVSIMQRPITDTVQVYHFIVAKSKSQVADTATTNSFMRESKIAYNWISSEAAKNGVPLFFKEHWPDNKDSNHRKTFAYKLPTTNLQKLLIMKSRIMMVTQKRTKDHPQKIEPVDWSDALFDSIAAHVTDKPTAELLHQHVHEKRQQNMIVIVHVLKAPKSRIAGFCRHERGLYIGDNTSSTIAHESIHYLGAPDLYIHKYWFGKKRRTVRLQLWDEIMSSGIVTTRDCRLHAISNYTAYTLGWTKTIDKKYKPLLKQNFMARLVFRVSLLI